MGAVKMSDLTRYKLCAGMKTTPSAKLIYCYLLDVSDKGYVIMSIGKIAKAVGLSRSAAGHSLHRLKKLELISVFPRYTEDGGRLANQYQLK
jgi:DNA-binding transcriptional ArsR family regulator